MFCLKYILTGLLSLVAVRSYADVVVDNYRLSSDVSDAESIIRAINDTSANASVVWFGNRTYTVHRWIPVKANKTLRGVSQLGTVIRVASQAVKSASDALTHYSYNFSVFANNVNAADNVTIRDMTIDCNFDNQKQSATIPNWCTFAAIQLTGRNILVENVRFQGYGVGANGPECFVCSLGLHPSNTSNPIGGRILNCYFHQPAAISAMIENYHEISLAAVSGYHGLQSGATTPIWATGCLVSGNVFSNLRMTGAINGTQQSIFRGISFGHTYGAIIENNSFSGFDGFCIYNDTFPNDSLTIRNNPMIDVLCGIGFSYEINESDHDNMNMRLNTVYIYGNDIFLYNTRPSGSSGAAWVSRFGSPTGIFFYGPTSSDGKVYQSNPRQAFIPYNNIFIYDNEIRGPRVIDMDSNKLKNGHGITMHFLGLGAYDGIEIDNNIINIVDPSTKQGLHSNYNGVHRNMTSLVIMEDPSVYSASRVSHSSNKRTLFTSNNIDPAPVGGYENLKLSVYDLTTGQNDNFLYVSYQVP